MNNDKSNPPGIKDLAKALGISIGTVDRALHARPGVNAVTRSRVLKMAQKLGYRPNLAARNLKLNRRLRIAVQMPSEIASFFQPLMKGVRLAAEALGSGITLEVATYPRLGQGDVALLKEALKQDFDGFLITPGDPAAVQPLIQEIAQRSTPVVCVASDAPRSERLGSVTVDAFVSGSLAAELLAQTVPGNGQVAVLTGELSTFDHAEKLRGFAATLATLAPHLTLLPVSEGHENPGEAYAQTRKLLARKPLPCGIYVNTANSMPVMRALEEHGAVGKIKVITTDLFPTLVPLIESGAILATLYQRPETQGRMAFDMLVRYLLEGLHPAAQVRLAPHIIMRSNLPLFLDRIISARSNKETSSVVDRPRRS